MQKQYFIKYFQRRLYIKFQLKLLLFAYQND